MTDTMLTPPTLRKNKKNMKNKKNELSWLGVELRTLGLEVQHDSSELTKGVWVAWLIAYFRLCCCKGGNM